MKHLEMIQSIINRMAQNSFLIKGWSITLAAAILAFAAEDGNAGLATVTILPTLAFWFLDAYYLRQERLFRNLHQAVADDIRNRTELVPHFDMQTARFAGPEETLERVACSATMVWLHVSVLVIELIAIATLGG